MSALAFCSGVALLVLMMLTTAALLFKDIIDAAIDHHGASATRAPSRTRGGA